MTCPRCQRLLIGRTKWCLVHGETVDFGPYAGESQSDRRQIMRKDRQADPLAEADDYAENLCLPGFELPRERPMVVQTFSDGEMTSWVRANSR